MDDNQNLQEKQTIEEIVPEELPPEVQVPTIEQVAQAGPELPHDAPPPVYEENKNQYLIIAGGVVFFLIILIIVFMVFFGGKSKPKEVSLTYWGLWEEKEAFLPLIQLYQQKNPHVKIDYQKMAPQDYREKLIARSKNEQGPDLFRFHNTWVPEIKELITPLPESIMPSSEFEKLFYKVHQNDLKIGKYYYGLPLEIDGLVLISNMGLLNKAGITVIPGTWEELIDAVTKLTVKDKNGQIITAGIAIGTTSNVEHFSDIFGLMLVQNGGNLKQLDQNEAIGALESYRKFAETPQNFWTDSMPNSLTGFIQEKVAMMIAPSWETLIVKNANPDMKIKVSPVPTVPGTNSVSLASYWVEGVSRYSKNQTEAWKFLRFLVEKDSLTKLYENESKIRLFGEPYSRIDLASFLVQNEYIGAVIKQADSFVTVPLVSKTYDNGLNDEIIKYVENAINSTAQGVSYQEALKTAKQGIDQIFSKYSIQ